MKTRTLVLAGALTLSVPAISQTAAEESLIKTGYLLPKFEAGQVLFKNGNLEDALLNYNTNTSAIAYEQGIKHLIITNLDEIDTVFFDDKKFVPVDTKFYEVVAVDSDITLLATYKLDLKPMQTDPGHGVSTTEVKTKGEVSNVVGGDGMPRRFKNNVQAVYSREFYLKKTKDQAAYRIRNEKQLIKAFPDKEEQIKAYLKDNQVNFTESNEVVQLLSAVILK